MIILLLMIIPNLNLIMKDYLDAPSELIDMAIKR